MPKPAVDQGFAKNQAQNVGALRAHRDANADLARALQDRVRNHSVQTDHRENQREAGETADEQ